MNENQSAVDPGRECVVGLKEQFWSVARASSLNAFKELWDDSTFNLVYPYHLGASRSLVHRKHRPSF